MTATMICMTSSVNCVTSSMNSMTSTLNCLLLILILNSYNLSWTLRQHCHELCANCEFFLIVNLLFDLINEQ